MLLELNRCQIFFPYISDLKKHDKKFNEKDYFEISKGNHVIPEDLSKLLKSFLEIESSEA